MQPTNQIQLSDSMSALAGEFSGRRVSAWGLARALIGMHLYYGDGLGESVANSDFHAGSSEDAPVGDWFERIQGTLVLPEVPVLHGRLVVLALSYLDQEVGDFLSMFGLLTAMRAELKEPIERVFQRPIAAYLGRASSPKAGILSRVTFEALEVLEVAEATRRAAGAATLHMEHLTAGLLVAGDPRTREVLDWAGLRKAGDLHALLAGISETKLPSEIPDLVAKAPSLGRLPPLSRHTTLAFMEASGKWKGLQPVAPLDILGSVLDLEQCSVAKALGAPTLAAVQKTVQAIGNKLGRLPTKEEVATELQMPVERLQKAIQSDRAPDRRQEEPAGGKAVVPAGRAAMDEPTTTLSGLPNPGYRSDGARGEDRLGIGAEVDALCSVIAARDVGPPLSVGLFGDWGSGKSFFMHEMNDRIADLEREAVAALDRGEVTAYCPSIVQIWFNAWHYAETDLWSALADEIFHRLADEMGRKDRGSQGASSDPGYQKARLEAAAADAKAELQAAEARKTRSEAQVAEVRAQLADLDRDEVPLRGVAGPALLWNAWSEAVQDKVALEKFERVAKLLGIEESTGGQVREAVTALPALGGKLRSALRGARHGWSWPVVGGLTIAMVVLLAVVFLVPAALGQKVVAAWQWIATLVLPLVPIAAPALKAFRALTAVSEAHTAALSALDKARTEQKSEIRGLLGKAEEELGRARKAAEEAARKDEDAQKGLDLLRPDAQIAAFIRSRDQSSDYRANLGTVSRLRSDFERLATLLDRQRQEGKSAEEKVLPGVDRIVLYVDDLDRCPEGKVVDVLQAVHLLLAFPLFVVVVGVDARWLLHSLQSRSPAFQDEINDPDLDPDDRVHWRSTPQDYLEKIFQIPFTLRPMDSEGFGALVADLVASSGRSSVGEPAARARSERVEGEERGAVAPAGPDRASSLGVPDGPGDPAAISLPRPDDFPAGKAVAAAGPGSAGDVASEQRQGSEEDGRTSWTVQKMVPALAPRRPIDPNPRLLVLEEWEVAALQQLHPVIGSPRAAKRLINTYRLLRVAVTRDLPDFSHGAAEKDYRSAILLLGMLTGFPSESSWLFREILEAPADRSWWEFFDGLSRGLGRSLKDAEQGEQGDHCDESDEQAAVLAQESRAEFLEAVERLRHEAGGAAPSCGPVGDGLDCGQLASWIPRVARYSFQPGRLVAEGSWRRGGS